MSRLLVLTAALSVAIALAAGSPGRKGLTAEAPTVMCDETELAAAADAGTPAVPRGLLMVADLAAPPSCTQGG